MIAIDIITMLDKKDYFSAFWDSLTDEQKREVIEIVEAEVKGGVNHYYSDLY